MAAKAAVVGLIALSILLVLTILAVSTYVSWRLRFKHRNLYRSFRTWKPWWRRWTGLTMTNYILDQTRFSMWWSRNGYSDLGDPALARAGETLTTLNRIATPVVILALVSLLVFSILNAK